MTCGDKESGDELYQDTMLKLLGKRRQLDPRGNAKSYALSVAILLWKNKKKKYANRNRLIPTDSLESLAINGDADLEDLSGVTPEDSILLEEEMQTVQQAVADLPEKYRMPVYLHYSADLTVREIAAVLKIPEGTVKSRMNKAKQLLKVKLEAIGYDR